MTLKLKGTPIASNKAKEKIQRTFDIVEEVKQQMAAIDLQPFPKPRITPEPMDEADLDSLSDRELGKYMVMYNGYASYLQTKLVEAQIAYRASTITMKTVKNSLKASLFKDRVPKAEVDARVANSAEFIEAELEQLKLYAIAQMLEAHYNAYSKQAATVSRLVETRKLDYEKEMRAHNVSTYRPNGQHPNFKRRV